MKRILGLALLSVAPAALALELTPDTSNQLTDLMYVPAQGTIFGLTSLEMGSTKGDFGDDDLEADDQYFRQEVRYGVSDRWQVYATYEHRLKGELEVANADSEQDGPQNPFLGTLYRFAPAHENSLTLDAFVAYSPDLFDREYDADNSDYARGGDAWVFGLRFGRKFKEFEMSAGTDMQWNLESDAEGKDGSADTTTHAQHISTSFVALQKAVAEAVLVNGSIRYRTTGGADVKTEGVDGTVQDPDVASFRYGVGALWSALPEKLALGLDLAYECFADYKDAGTQVKDMSAWWMGINARYQF